MCSKREVEPGEHRGSNVCMKSPTGGLKTKFPFHSIKRGDPDLRCTLIIAY